MDRGHVSARSVFDPARGPRRTCRRALRAGRRIDLTAKEFALLELLLRRQGEVLPRSLIASQVWDMNFDSDTNVIEVAVRRLRAKVDDEFEPKLIRTVRGMGYVIEMPASDARSIEAAEDR
jgi:two-component system copper resistance phosphate regulon response regulator CusR